MKSMHGMDERGGKAWRRRGSGIIFRHPGLSMKVHYLNERMADGSRLFAVTAEPCPWARMHAWLQQVEGLTLGGPPLEGLDEVWADFRYLNHDFTVHAVPGEMRFFVGQGEATTLVLNFLLEQIRALPSSQAGASDGVSAQT